MKPRIEPSSSRAPVLAQTIDTCAVEPLVIHILAPFSTQPSAVSFATVIRPPGFEPKSGSVRPKQPITLPLAISGSHFFFCSSEQKAKIGYITRPPCTDANERTP